LADPSFDVRHSPFVIRLILAIVAGKLAGAASRRLGRGGGTTLPGTIARRIDPGILMSLCRRLPRGAVLVTGTNGKTTTARLLATILEQAGLPPVHNRAGANLLVGITSALLSNTTLGGWPRAPIGLFEVDEATLPGAVREVQPQTVVFTNLFRDQLDRYGELDTVARLWREAIAALPPEATVILNADDPTLAALGEGAGRRVLYYGIADRRYAQSTLPHNADAIRCLACGAPYNYQAIQYGHLGEYRCPGCGRERPRPNIVATEVVMDGVQGSRCRVSTPAGELDLHIGISGLFNVYNTLAALSASLSLSIAVVTIKTAIAGFAAAFGRLERVQVGEKSLFLALIKNPVGCTEALRTVLSDPEATDFLILINDHLADGTDVSWLWDAEFEWLAGRAERITVGGRRAGDMAVRLKYAGLDPATMEVVSGSDAQALDRAMARLPAGKTLYILPTYTAMLSLRGVMSQRGYVTPFWQD